MLKKIYIKIQTVPECTVLRGNKNWADVDCVGLLLIIVYETHSCILSKPTSSIVTKTIKGKYRRKLFLMRQVTHLDVSLFSYNAYSDISSLQFKDLRSLIRDKKYRMVASDSLKRVCYC